MMNKKERNMEEKCKRKKSREETIEREMKQWKKKLRRGNRGRGNIG
jgi:hypothetical protein